MKKKPYLFTLIILFITCNSTLLFAWGFWAHQRINRAAIFALPDSMRVFFYNHIDFITEEAQMPDVRIYAINYKEEANRHYIDLEMLHNTSYEKMPGTLAEAKAKFGDSLLQKSGLLPWYIDDIMTKLTKAFHDKNKPYILLQAGDLAHYIGDAHMPLHTTVNHDGQLTGQKGIHSFWEAQLPESFGGSYNFYTGGAVYINDTRKEIWRIMKDSHRLVDTLLLAEKALQQQFPADQMYEKDAAGNIFKNKYGQTKHSLAYAKKYHEMLNGMVEHQMKLSIAAVANFWYTAWVNGGKPDLINIDAQTLTQRNKKLLKKDLKLWKKGKLFGLKTFNEF
jgi:hypothetical protein